MGKYNDLSDQERKKLYRDFSKAAQEIRIQDEPAGRPAGEAAARPRAERLLLDSGRRRRPRYRIRLKIESYAFSEGFEISGLRQYLASLFSFLWPARDLVSDRLARSLAQDSPHRAGPAGYSLARTLQEMGRVAELLLKGEQYLRRHSDRQISLRGELSRDLLNWEPAGYRLLAAYFGPSPSLLEALDFVRRRYESQQSVDVFDLVEVVKAVYRYSLSVQAEPEAVQERIVNVGELVKGLCKRIYSDEEKIQQICVRIDHQVEDFLGCYARLKWFTQALYPALLKMLNLYRRQEQVGEILAEIYSFIGLKRKDVLLLEQAEPQAGSAPRPAEYGSGRGAANGAEQEAAEAQGEGGEDRKEAFDFNEEYRGILTILDYAFPGSRLKGFAEGDYSGLLWFHQRIFSHREHRGALVSRRPDFADLLWKVSLHDPLAPLIVFHELIGHMLESLNPDALAELADPMRGQAARVRDKYLDVLREWRMIREELLLRALREVDYFEKEVSLRGREVQNLFLGSAAARKTIETVNQIRNHLIRGYGHVALTLDRREYFRCRPFYTVVKELQGLLAEIVVERGQLAIKNPIVLQRLERDDLIRLQPGPLMNQIRSYIEALPQERRLLDNPKGEFNRQFLEILLGLTEALHFLIGDERSWLPQHGAALVFAGTAERELRKEIDSDKTPLRVDLKKDFEEIDRLTGLFSKNEYLRFMPVLFRESRAQAGSVSLLVMDLDRFKAINDTRGHDFGDQIIRLAAEVVLASAREEDLGVRFGGDEILVVVRGEAGAAAGQAERIRSRYAELLEERYGAELKEVPLLTAQKELLERKKADPLYPGGLEDFLERWKGKAAGTLSIGAAQGLGAGLSRACADEKELFRRADRMLYLAKEGGGNRVVVMIDSIEVPLTWEEYVQYLEYLEEIRPAERPQKAGLFVDLRLAHNQTLSFSNYPYREYLENGR